MRRLPHLMALFVLCGAVPPASGGEPLWVEIDRLRGSDTDANDQFGLSLSIDGGTLVVSAPVKDAETGAVYVFEGVPGPSARWEETAKLEPSVAGDWFFGRFVELDGDVIAISALAGGNGGSVTYLFGQDADGPNVWGPLVRFVANEGGLGTLEGSTLAYSHSRADIGGELDAGAVHLFERGPDGADDWSYTATLVASDASAQDHFGSRVALSGDRMLVGAPQVRDLGIDSGAAYVFERNETGAWVEVMKLLASDGNEFDDFGGAVDLDAETAIVGGDADGTDEAAYVFERDEVGSWVEKVKLLPSDGDLPDGFGPAVAADGDVGAVGSWNHDVPGFDGAGAVYLYERHAGGAGAWGEVAKVVASTPERNQAFGTEVALAGNTLVVGVPFDDSQGLSSGVVYLFSRTAPLLAVTGSCPGAVEVTLIGATPGGRVVLVGSPSEGAMEVPSGPCQGLEVGLAEPRPVFAGEATSGGDLTLQAQLGAGSCGGFAQAVDVEACVATAVVGLP